MADANDFETIALPHLDCVFRVAMTFCRDTTAAEDLTQTAYLKALQRFATFRPGTNIKAWLLRILRNTWIDQLRHRKVVGPSVPVEEEFLPDRPEGETTAWTDARDLLENFSDQQVIQALGRLPEDQRLTLYLVDVEQLSQDETAEITGVAVGTVKSRSSRARQTLKEILLDHARDLGFVERRS